MFSNANMTRASSMHKEDKKCEFEYTRLLKASENLLMLYEELNKLEEVYAETEKGNTIRITRQKLNLYKEEWKRRFQSQNRASRNLRKARTLTYDIEKPCFVPDSLRSALSEYCDRFLFNMKDILQPTSAFAEGVSLERNELFDTSLDVTTVRILLRAMETSGDISYSSGGSFQVSSRLAAALNIQDAGLSAALPGKVFCGWDKLREALFRTVQYPEGFEVQKGVMTKYKRFRKVYSPVKAACLSLCIFHDPEALQEANFGLYVRVFFDQKSSDIV